MRKGRPVTRGSRAPSARRALCPSRWSEAARSKTAGEMPLLDTGAKSSLSRVSRSRRGSPQKRAVGRPVGRSPASTRAPRRRDLRISPCTPSRPGAARRPRRRRETAHKRLVVYGDTTSSLHSAAPVAGFGFSFGFRLRRRVWLRRRGWLGGGRSRGRVAHRVLSGLLALAAADDGESGDYSD